MLEPFEKKLRQVRRRCSVNFFLQKSGAVLIVAGSLAILAILIQRLCAFWVFRPSLLWASGAIALTTITILWWFSRPNAFQTALLVDGRLQLHERFSTAMALAQSSSPFAHQAKLEIRERVSQIQLSRQFPVKPTRCWGYASLIWIVMFLLVAFLPQKDLLGFLAQKETQQQQAKKIQQDRQLVQDSTRRIKLVVKQLGDPELDADLASLESLTQNSHLNTPPRQAIRKLGDLADRIKKMQNRGQADSLAMMQKMLRQLKGASGQELSQKFRYALAQGKFPQASSLLRQMQKQLERGELSDRQKRQLSEQMQNLAQQIKALVDEKNMLEKELQKRGLDKKLAKLGEKELREALTKKGLDAKKIEELMQKAAASRMAANRCSSLAEAMAAASGAEGGLSSESLAELADQFSDIESFQKQIKLTQATLDEIENAIACLGKGQCQGQGKQGPWRAGDSSKSGSGTGGPGVGYGPRNSDTDGETTAKTTRVNSPAGKGPVVASWYFKGSQVKGQSHRPLAEVVQSARDNAAEAISDNEIPPKYQDSVKQYFSQLGRQRQ